MTLGRLVCVPFVILLGSLPCRADEPRLSLKAVLETDHYDFSTLDSEDVIVTCSQGIKQKSSLPVEQLRECLWKRGHAYRRSRKYEDAANDFRQLVQSEPRNSLNTLALAWVLFDADDCNRANSILNELLKTDPRNAQVVALAAYFRAQSLDIRQAEALLERIDMTQTEDAFLGSVRAFVALQLGQPNDAITFASDSIKKLCAKSRTGMFDELAEPTSYFVRGYARELMNDPKGAVIDFRCALNVTKDPYFDREITKHIWGCFLTEGKYELCRSMALRLEKNGDDSVTTAYLRGVRLLVEGKPKKALESLANAKTCDVPESRLENWRACLYFADGQSQRAIQAIQKAWENAPTTKGRDVHLSALQAYILCSSPEPNVRDGAEALKLADACLQMTQNTNPRLMMLKAMALAEVGSFDEAPRFAQKSIDMLSKDSPLRPEYSRRLLLFKAKKSFRFDAKSGIFDFLTYCR